MPAGAGRQRRGRHASVHCGRVTILRTGVLCQVCVCVRISVLRCTHPLRPLHSELHAACEDGLAYVCDKKWGTFERPKIAFRGGWGRPGTYLADHTRLKLVKQFRDVFASDTPLNLQVCAGSVEGL